MIKLDSNLRLCVFCFLFISLAFSFCSVAQKSLEPSLEEKRIISRSIKYQIYPLKTLLKKELTAKNLILLIQAYGRTKKRDKSRQTIIRHIKLHIKPVMIKPLLLRLKYLPLKNKRRTAFLLAVLNDPELSQELYRLLHDQNRSVNQHAFLLLSYHSSAKLNSLFRQSLHKKTPRRVKLKVLKILGYKKNWRSLDIVFSLYSNRDVVIKAYCIWSFRQIKKRHPDKIKAFLLIKLRLPLLNQRKAVYILASLKEYYAVLPMINLLHHCSKSNRHIIAKSLVALVHHRNMDYFRSGVKTANPLVKKELIWVLGESRNKKAIPILINCLSSRNRYLKNHAVMALLKFQKKSISKHLVRIISDQSPLVRRRIIWALGNLKNNKILKSLLATLDDQDKKVRYYAKWAILRLVKKSNCQILFNPNLGRSRFAKMVKVEALGRVKSKRAFAFLKSALEQEKDSAMKIKIIIALGNILDKRSRRLLLRELKSRNPLVRAFVTRALGKLKDKRIFSRFVELLKDPHPLVRKEAVRALARLRMKKGIKPLLYRLYYEKDEKVKKAVTKALFLLESKADKKELLKI